MARAIKEPKMEEGMEGMEGIEEGTEEGIEGEDTMTSEVIEEQVSENQSQVEQASSFPRTIGEKTFYSAEELQQYIAQLDALRSESRGALKEMGISVPGGRAPSQRKQLAESLAGVINDNRDAFSSVFEMVSQLEEDTSIRVEYNKETGMFRYPTPTKSGEGTGSGGRRAEPLNVDGKEYPSAKGARDTLHPEMVGKSQNRTSIISYLKREGHNVAD
jgi:hypothetical protein